MSERFVFDLCLGGDSVKRVVFASGQGRREIRTSGGVVIGSLVLKNGALKLNLDEDAAQVLVDAQFH